MTENDRVLGPQKVGEEGKSPYFRENIGWWNNIIWPDEMFGLLCAFCNKLWLWHSLMSLMSILPRSKHDELRQQRCFFFFGGGVGGWYGGALNTMKKWDKHGTCWWRSWMIIPLQPDKYSSNVSQPSCHHGTSHNDQAGDGKKRKVSKSDFETPLGWRGP